MLPPAGTNTDPHNLCWTGRSPTSTEHTFSTSGSRVPGCRSLARTTTSATDVGPSTSRTSRSTPAAALAAAQYRTVMVDLSGLAISAGLISEDSGAMADIIQHPRNGQEGPR